MRRTIEIAAAILLIVGGTLLFYYYSSKEGLALAGLSVFAKRAAVRMVVKFIGILLIPFIPAMIIRKGSTIKEYIGKSARSIVVNAKQFWKESPWPVRLVLAAVYVFGSGVLVFILLIIPVPVQRIPFVGAWLKNEAVPFLMRGAAARGVELNLPKIWGKVPACIREPFNIIFWWIWWNTAALAIRTSRMSAVKLKTILAERGKRKASEKQKPVSMLETRKMRYHI